VVRSGFNNLSSAKASSTFADVSVVIRSGLLLCFLLTLVGCRRDVRMAQPEDPHGRYREQIATARRLLEQKESWTDRVEWEVIKTSTGWQVIAWRIEHPEAKGPNRYLPWGYSVIELDSRLTTTGYRRKG
jgi:hypothetical protein